MTQFDSEVEYNTFELIEKDDFIVFPHIFSKSVVLFLKKSLSIFIPSVSLFTMKLFNNLY